MENAAVSGVTLEDVCLNPFSAISNVSDELSHLNKLVLRMAFENRDYAVDDYQRSVVESAIVVVYSNKSKDACIDDIAQYLLSSSDRRDQEIGTKLYPYTRNGHYGKLFCGVRNVESFDDPLIQQLLEKNSGLRDILPRVFFGHQERKLSQSVAELLSTSGRDLVISGLQALHRERVSAWHSVSVVSLQRGEEAPSRQMFGVHEVTALLNALGSAPSERN